ncbi:hypothetical protein CCB80_03305 [Armatimonadetes bacterium Uphvl-Ar1]|nr:hypothetical protein CCB80_03305 [Armatimonadetes bacterium Uphvl-Ar1]
MAVYETGRIRDIVFEVSGNLESKLKHLYPGFSFIAYDGGCDFSFLFLPTTIFRPYLRFSNLPSTAGTLNWGVNAGVLFDGEDTAGDFLEPDDYNVDYFLEKQIGFAGSVTIPGVKEVFEVVDLPGGDYTTITGTNFPAFGGTAQADGIMAKKITFYEIIPEGTGVTVSGTLGGTAIWTWYTPSDIPMGYPVQIIGDLTIGSSAAPEADDIVADWRVDFEGEQLTADWGTITPDAQGSFMDWDNAKAGFVAVMSGGLGESNCNMVMAPDCVYDCNFKAFTFGVSYPGSIGLWLWDKRVFSSPDWVYGYKEVVANPTYNETVRQKLHQLQGGTNLATNTTIVKEEWQGIRWNLDPDLLNSEDADDWRVQIRGTKWDALTVLQNATHDLDDGSSATGWAGSGVSVSSSGGNLVFA